MRYSQDVFKQIVPGTIQRPAQPGEYVHRWIPFPRLNPLQIPATNLGLFGQLLLGQSLFCSQPTDILAHAMMRRQLHLVTLPQRNGLKAAYKTLYFLRTIGLRPPSAGLVV